MVGESSRCFQTLDSHLERPNQRKNESVFRPSMTFIEVHVIAMIEASAKRLAIKTLAVGVTLNLDDSRSLCLFLACESGTSFGDLSKAPIGSRHAGLLAHASSLQGMGEISSSRPGLQEAMCRSVARMWGEWRLEKAMAHGRRRWQRPCTKSTVLTTQGHRGHSGHSGGAEGSIFLGNHWPGMSPRQTPPNLRPSWLRRQWSEKLQSSSSKLRLLSGTASQSGCSSQSGDSICLLVCNSS
jgi:hypothetical protein